MNNKRTLVNLYKDIILSDPAIYAYNVKLFGYASIPIKLNFSA
jgi:hypothetical protein